MSLHEKLPTLKKLKPVYGSCKMSRIISISRKTGGAVMPDTFILGRKPIMQGVAIEEDSPLVSAIKYWEASPPYVREYNGPLYIIEFENSTVKRIIPKDAMLDIAVETKKEEDKLPGLPKAEKNIE